MKFFATLLISVFRKQASQLLRRKPTRQGARGVRVAAKILKPDPPLGLALIDGLPTVRCEDKRDFVIEAVDDPGALLRRGEIGEVPGAAISPRLFDAALNGLLPALGLDDGHGGESVEEHIIGGSGGRGHLGDGELLSVFGARAAGPTKFLCVGAPAALSKLRVDDRARLSFVELDILARFAHARLALNALLAAGGFGLRLQP